MERLDRIDSFFQRMECGGEEGIRTLGSFRVTGFQDQLLKPLGHLSIRDADYFNITAK